MYSEQQLRYVAQQANKIGGHGKRLVDIIPPRNTSDGEFNFQFIVEIPNQLATEKDWRDN